MNMNTNIVDIIDFIDELYRQEGNFISYEDREEDIPITLKELYDDNRIIFEITDVIDDLCEANGIEVIEYNTIKVFENPSYAIYILSYVLKYQEKIYTSLNNVYEWC